MLSVYIGLPVEYGVLLSAFVVGAYTISGGLAAVAISSTPIQLFIMFTGGLLVTYFGLEAIGGWDVFISTYATKGLPAAFTGIFTLRSPGLSMAWCHVVGALCFHRPIGPLTR